MIGRGNVLGNFQVLAEFLGKLGHEAHISVTDDLHGQTESLEHVV